MAFSSEGVLTSRVAPAAPYVWFMAKVPMGAIEKTTNSAIIMALAILKWAFLLFFIPVPPKSYFFLNTICP